MALRQLALTLILSLATICLSITQALAKETNVFVWKVWKDGTSAQSSYLIGTIHLPVASESALPTAVRQAMASASTFVMEADLSSLTPALLNRFIADPNGNQLHETLPTSTWKKLVNFCKAKGISEETLPYLKPWFLSLLTSLPANQPKTILDSVLRSEAEAHRLPVNFLERPEDQLTQLDRVASKESVSMLQESLEHPERNALALARIEAEYRMGELAAIEKDVFDPEQMKQSPDFFKRTIDERNAKWLPAFKRYAQSGSFLIAVGLAHLIGEKGLLQSLKNEGYRVEFIPVR